MASIESRIETFITEHELDPDMKDEICVLVTGCMEDLFKHVFTQSVPSTDNKKAKKVLKADKVEDPSSCESYDDLRNCTTGILNQFCKDKTLKVGGNKKEIMDRVWRHIQGESSDEDKSSRGKPKTPKKTAEKHVCSGTKASGEPCAISATEEFGDCYFCHRHITDAQKFVDAMRSTIEPVKSKPKKSSIVPKEAPKQISKPDPKEISKQSKGKKVVPPPVPEQELVTDSDDDSDQQETDNDN
jgi:hypothetical protein